MSLCLCAHVGVECSIQMTCQSGAQLRLRGTNGLHLTHLRNSLLLFSIRDNFSGAHRVRAAVRNARRSWCETRAHRTTKVAGCGEDTRERFSGCGGNSRDGLFLQSCTGKDAEFPRNDLPTIQGERSCTDACGGNAIARPGSRCQRSTGRAVSTHIASAMRVTHLQAAAGSVLGSRAMLSDDCCGLPLSLMFRRNSLAESAFRIASSCVIAPSL